MSKERPTRNITKDNKEKETEEDTMKKMFEEFTKKITTQMNKIESKISLNTTQYKEIKEMLDDMKTSLDMMNTKQAQLQEENDKLKKDLEELKTDQEDRIDFLENRSRNSNLEIRNIPETKGENVISIIQKIGQAIGIGQIMEGDIQVAHRVDTKKKGIRPIIAHMASRYMRNKWLHNYRKSPGKLSTKTIHQNLPDQPIYINEHITVRKKLLLNEAKELAKVNHIKYVWVKDGFILLKKNDSDKHVQKINTRGELETYRGKLLARTPTETNSESFST